MEIKYIIPKDFVFVCDVSNVKSYPNQNEVLIEFKDSPTTIINIPDGYWYENFRYYPNDSVIFLDLKKK